MIGLVHLYRTLNSRCNPKEDSQPDNQSNCKPKVVPLYRISSIIPPLPQVLGLRLIKSLLQDHKSIMPENELADLSFCCFQATFAGCLAINTIVQFRQALLFL